MAYPLPVRFNPSCDLTICRDVEKASRHRTNEPRSSLDGVQHDPLGRTLLCAETDAHASGLPSSARQGPVTRPASRPPQWTPPTAVPVAAVALGSAGAPRHSTW